VGKAVLLLIGALFLSDCISRTSGGQVLARRTLARRVRGQRFCTPSLLRVWENL
jgi:hypothetical protein